MRAPERQRRRGQERPAWPGNADNTVISTRDLTRSFPTGVALDGLTMDLRRGEVLALLGPNGAGKTTTVRLLNGILRPDRGSADVLGFDPTVAGDEVRRRTGVLTEVAGLDERLTARENLTFTARIRALPEPAAGRRIDDLLERFGMADRAGDLVQGFSTGQRKRVALARALLHDPEVLFLDEPTSELDPSSTREVVELIATLAAERGRTILLCTHFLGEAGRLAHRMGVLHRGRLRALGRPEDLARDHWDGFDADIDIGAAADERTIAAVAAVPGVLAALPRPEGLRLRAQDRSALPEVVAALVDRGAPVYAAVPRAPTLEDVYFAIEAGIAAADAECAARSDGPDRASPGESAADAAPDGTLGKTSPDDSATASPSRPPGRRRQSAEAGAKRRPQQTDDTARAKQRSQQTDSTGRR
ncbi:MAG: ABC transporter ATP-binding protein [Acidimicrobiia bacterium]